MKTTTKPRTTHASTRIATILSLLVCLILTACNSDEHHIKFKVDEYTFIDKVLEKNIEDIIAQQFNNEPHVPLDISFENPCGLIISIFNLWEETQRDTVVGTFDVKIKTHHYDYYGYGEDSLQYWVEGCCMLAGHLCYIHPDKEYFNKTKRKQKVSFTTHDEYCVCAERDVCLNIINRNEVQVVATDELLHQFGNIGLYTNNDNGYDSLLNDYLSKKK